eukprot:Gb_29668 [translate_table: standard]
MEGHDEQPPKITDLDTTCTWQTPEPSVREGGAPLVFDIQTKAIKMLFAKLKKQPQEDSIKDTERWVEQLLLENEASTYTQLGTNLDTNVTNDFSKLILEGLRNLIFKLGAILGMPNYDYGFNKGFPYTPYPVTSPQFNSMMQYPMLGNSFRFGGPFSLTNGTPSMPKSSNNYGGINNNSNNGNGGNNNGNNNNGVENNHNNHHVNNGSSAFNGSNVFHFPNTSLQSLKYEGYGDLSENLANNIAQRQITNEMR